MQNKERGFLMDITIIDSYKGAKAICPIPYKIVIENKTKIEKNILLHMVQDIVNKSMPYIKKGVSADHLVRMVFTEQQWGISGVQLTESGKYLRIHTIFVRIPTDKGYYSKYRKKNNLSITKTIDDVSDRFYRVTVHELQHLEDELANASGENRPISQAIRYRRAKHDSRPEEVRADKTMNEFNIDYEIHQNLMKEITKKYLT